MPRSIPTIAELGFARIAQAARDWLAAHTCQPEETTEVRKDEADAQLDAVLRCETKIRPDQAIEHIWATDNGVGVELEDGFEFSINASTGFIEWSAPD